jgi:hypothetical protein
MMLRHFPVVPCSPPPRLACLVGYYSACRGIMFMSSHHLFKRVNLFSTNLRFFRWQWTRAKHIYHCSRLISEQSFVKRQNHTSITTNMSLLQHTGPSTLYTEFAELPLPVSADFVGSDGAFKIIKLEIDNRCAMPVQLHASLTLFVITSVTPYNPLPRLSPGASLLTITQPLMIPQKLRRLQHLLPSLARQSSERFLTAQAQNVSSKSGPEPR